MDFQLEDLSLLDDPYQHAACGTCYPILDGPYPVYIGLCGRRATTMNAAHPKCPDCVAVMMVLRRCQVCFSNIWFEDYEEEETE